MNLTPADTTPAWCPGCGNYPILKTINQALDECGIDPHRIVLVSGIGQAAKLPHYVDNPVNVFNGLHGRALPVATGIKLANHELTVIVTSGDGDMYGEGGNHFIHAIRRNVSLKVFVHNNQVYALTKGQASPTSEMGFVTKIQSHGVTSSPFNPLATAIMEDAAFVARSFSGDQEHLKKMMLDAIAVQTGFCLLDILQPCVTFNKLNTFRWYKDRVRKIDDSHDAHDGRAALDLAFQWGDTIPIGVLYRGKRKGLESQIGALKKGPLVKQVERENDQ
ncbi:MAG: 2-oxoglutarate oxidoreductase subunit KorB [Planctomycetes bacterium ADurb.Bin126]|nr:MAG: 2-oxoglutarate oxidoreductase subunit KorB [Planctomycetes bacterium ADurb.Bin126]HOD81882.1 2-oxoacid:ferredoxin oxidoreductase subunit beta [Phycisphaerae bacterium]HQL74595.1 2-oxoacid:ferredoxin oxidoreductase subunit beta [Phycisphaerae bacterium]